VLFRSVYCKDQPVFHRIYLPQIPLTLALSPSGGED
jgi:hypothetical protein